MVESSSTSMSGPSSVSMEQLQVDLARLTSLVSSLQSPSMASFGNFGMSSSPFPDDWYCGMTVLAAPLVSDTTWVLDTGATEHMTSFNHMFVSYEKHVGSGQFSQLMEDVSGWLASGPSLWTVSTLSAMFFMFPHSALCLCLHSVLLMTYLAPFIFGLMECSYLTRWGRLLQ